MSVLLELAVDVDWPDDEAGERVRAGSAHSAGGLVDLAEWLAAAQAAYPPRVPSRVRLLRFGSSDASLPVSAGDGVAHVGVPHVGVRAVAGAGSDAEAAVRSGAALADDEIDGGADLCLVTVAGSQRAAAVLVSVLTDTEPVKVLPRGTAMDPAHWMAAAEAIRDERRSAYGLRADPFALLDAVGTPDVCAAVGFVLRAAARRTPMLLDGLGAAAAGLVAFESQPRSARWWRPADTPGQPAARVAFGRTGQSAVLGLGTDLADGTAAVLAADVLRTAAAVAAVAARAPR